MRPKLVKA